MKAPAKSVPPLMAASRKQLRTLLHEQNQVVGRANRLLEHIEARARTEGIGILSKEDAVARVVAASLLMGALSAFTTAYHTKFPEYVAARTGLPVAHTAAVSVLAADAMTADALATVLGVLSPDEALAFAAESGVACLIVTGSGAARASAAWPG